MNKYYIPEIEEFYVGFEYERFVPKSNTTEEECWNKLSMSVNYLSLNDIDYEIIEKEIRVKYLDQEDIENLGWTIDEVHKDKEQKLYFKDNIVLYYRYKTKKLGVFTKNFLKNDYYSKYNKDPHSIHSITIKNKSEFKKLLKQLQIE